MTDFISQGGAIPFWHIAITAANVVGFVKLAVDHYRLSNAVKTMGQITDYNNQEFVKSITYLRTQLVDSENGPQEQDSGLNKQD